MLPRISGGCQQTSTSSSLWVSVSYTLCRIGTKYRPGNTQVAKGQYADTAGDFGVLPSTRRSQLRTKRYTAIGDPVPLGAACSQRFGVADSDHIQNSKRNALCGQSLTHTQRPIRRELNVSASGTKLGGVSGDRDSHPRRAAPNHENLKSASIAPKPAEAQLATLNSR